MYNETDCICTYSVYMIRDPGRIPGIFGSAARFPEMCNFRPCENIEIPVKLHKVTWFSFFESEYYVSIIYAL